MKRRILYILIILFPVFLIPETGLTQEFEEFDVDRRGGEEEEEETEEDKPDIKPYIGKWKISENGAFQDSTELDTIIDTYQIYHPVFKEILTASYLGNYGLPALNNDFFNRKPNVEFLFFKTRDAYLLTPQNMEYYNTRTPFTRLDFGQSGNKAIKHETRFKFFHTRNVNKYLNLTLDINLAKSAGQYNSQESRNNYVAIYSSYNKDNLNIYGGFVTNTMENQENGGLTNDSLIYTGSETELLNTNLNNSKNLFKGTYYYVNGEYRFGKIIETGKDSGNFRPIFGILLNSQYERHKQIFFSDEAPDNPFFENKYYGDDYTTDSIRLYKLDNVFQLKQYENSNRKASFGKRAYLGIDFVNTTTPGRDSSIYAGPDTLIYESIVHKYSNLYVGGGIFRQTGKFWTWNFDGAIYLLGAKAGQTELNGIISKPLKIFGDSLASLVITGSLNNTVADYFQQEFFSNHYRWENNLSMEQSMNVGGSIISPRLKMKLTGNYSLINNYIYNNNKGIPSQTDKEILVLSAFADKDFNYRNLHFRIRALWQQASNEEFIHLPTFSGFVSAYYKFVISKVLFTQIGVDTRYYTKYYADAYSPATGLFYLQNEKKYGNYPYIDVYANLRLKRTIVFFKMLNVGTNFLDGEYITTPNYPMPRSTFRFGLSWLFYD